VEAIKVGLDDQSSLSKLAMLPETAAPAECATKITTIQRENTLGNDQRNKARRLANAELQADNKLLRREVEQLRTLSESKRGAEDFATRLAQEIERNDVLEKENKSCRNRIKQLEKRETDLKKQVREEMRNDAGDFEMDMEQSLLFGE
jgi:hypothetical protein